MKKFAILLLSLVLALGCFGALAGCGGKTDLSSSEPTDEEIITRLEKSIDGFTVAKLLESYAGVKIALKIDTLDSSTELSYAFKKVDAAIYSQITIAMGTETKTVYGKDGYSVADKGESKNNIVSYMPPEMLLSSVGMTNISPEGKETKTLLKGETDHQLRYVYDGIENYVKVVYTFDADNRITKMEATQYNAGSNAMTVTYGEQSFEVPEGVKGVDLTTDEAKLLKAATSSNLLYTTPATLLTDTQGITIVKNTVPAIPDDQEKIFIGETEMMRDRGIYGAYYNKGTEMWGYDPEEESGKQVNLEIYPFFMQDVKREISDISDKFSKIVYSGSAALTVAPDGSMQITSGEQYVKLSKDYYITEIKFLQNGKTKIDTIAYGKPTFTIPDAIKNYEMTANEQNKVKAFHQAIDFTKGKWYTQKGLEMNDGKAGYSFSFGEALEEGRLFEGDKTAGYVYRGKAHLLQDDAVSSVYSLESYAFYVEEILSVIANAKQVELGQNQIIVKDADGKKGGEFWFDAEGRLSKYIYGEDEADPSAAVTVTFTYDAQTVTIPDVVKNYKEQ